MNDTFLVCISKTERDQKPITVVFIQIVLIMMTLAML